MLFQITLKSARVNAGLTQDEVAEAVNRHVQTILKYEKDSSKIPSDLLEDLCGLYQIPKDNIFLGTNFENIRRIERMREKV